MKFSPRQKRHLILAACAFGGLAALFLVFGRSPEMWADHSGRKADWLAWRLSMSLAYAAVGFMVVTLSIGPLHVLRQGTRPANNMLRRDVALWAGGLALAHACVAVTVHAPEGWKIWWYWIRHRPTADNWFPIQSGWFGFANYVGLAQAAIFGLLLLLSNDIALRRLGTARWKRLQRLNYLAFGLVVAHGVTYQMVEIRDWYVRAALVALTMTAISVQLVGVAAVLRRRARPRPADNLILEG